MQELRTQLNDIHAAASESHAAIQSDLETHRAQRRAEDASRMELKTRTKTLEESKRSAETSKRDAEKRLRAAEGARDNASLRIGKLEKEIESLRVRMREDEAAVIQCREEADETERQIREELEKKRKEIKVAEDVVAALNARAKELEEKIAEEEEKVKRAREHAEIKKQDRSFYPLHVVPAVDNSSSSPWSPIAAAFSHPPPDLAQDPHSHINTEFSQHIDVFSQPLPIPQRNGSISSGSGDGGDPPVPSRPNRLSLGGISNFREPDASEQDRQTTAVGQPFLRTPPYPMFDDENSLTISSAHSLSTRFSPFGESDMDGTASSSPAQVAGISPMSTSLIPTSLYKTLNAGSSLSVDAPVRMMSFQSEDDVVLSRDWRKAYQPPIAPEAPAVFNSSPTSLTCPSFDAIDQEDPFEVRPPPPLRHRFTSEGFDAQRSAFNGPNRTTSEPQPLARARTHEDEDTGAASNNHRRWFSTSTKEKKGLNPQAKVFSLSKKLVPGFGPHPHEQQQQQQQQITHAGPGPFEPFAPPSAPPPPPPPPPPPSMHLTVPNGVFSTSPPDMDSLFSSITMRAFAPSPAEREALRALGGSSNTSLERLPTLSEVSSIPPSSPSHVHAIASQRSPAPSIAEVGTRGGLLSPGLAWLQSLPRMNMRKTKFSPWEDEMPESRDGEDK